MINYMDFEIVISKGKDNNIFIWNVKNRKVNMFGVALEEQEALQKAKKYIDNLLRER